MEHHGCAGAAAAADRVGCRRGAGRGPGRPAAPAVASRCSDRSGCACHAHYSAGTTRRPSTRDSSRSGSGFCRAGRLAGRAARRDRGIRRLRAARHRQQPGVRRRRPGAGLLLIGEPPGAAEDRSGRAFAGRPGSIWNDAGQHRPRPQPACCTPLIPWRPPGGRPPKRARLAACLPFLHRLIALTGRSCRDVRHPDGPHPAAGPAPRRRLDGVDRRWGNCQLWRSPG